ncbi:MAG: hypothetical protein LOD90_00525 [Symbiobacteriaceae bacterium]
MAKSKVDALKIEATPPESKPTQHPDETTYSRDELIAAAVSFGVRPEVMAGALRLAGLESATRAQAEAAVRQFLRREV